MLIVKIYHQNNEVRYQSLLSSSSICDTNHFYTN